MTSKRNHFVKAIAMLIILSNISLIINNPNNPLFSSKMIEGFVYEDMIELGPYEYYYETLNASKGEAIAITWYAEPYDVLPAPFQVFICTEEGFNQWIQEDNLTKAIQLLPTRDILYHYDARFRIDDLPGDMRRSHSRELRVPFVSEWHLVFYAGSAPYVRFFNWQFASYPSKILDWVLYGFIGLLVVISGIVVSIVLIKKKKKGELTEEEEIAAILEKERRKEQKKKERQGLGNIEGKEEEEGLEEFFRLKEKKEKEE
jgi:hypothetical protein